MKTVIEFYVSDSDRKNTVKSLEKYCSASKAKKIESGIYNKSKQFCTNQISYMPFCGSVYTEIYTNILFNFKSNNKTIKKLQRKVEQDEFNPYNIAYLKPIEMDKDNWAAVTEKRKNVENAIKNVKYYEWDPCVECGNTKYFHTQMQTRSADEPMTSYYKCFNCNKTYSVNN